MTDEVGVWKRFGAPAQQVMRRITTHGPQSRTQLGALLGLSPGSVTRVTKPLLDAGIAVEGSRVIDPASRRSSRLLDLPPSEDRFLGVKITSDEMHFVSTDARAGIRGRAHARLQERTPDEVVELIVATMGDLADAGRFAALGITLGGHARDDKAAVVDAPFLGWSGVPVADLVRERARIPVVVENDVTALAQAQRWFGVGRECHQFAVITIGVGVGYALVEGDQVVTSTEESLRRFSHHVLEEGGPVCALGHRGCASSLLTSGRMVRAASGASGGMLTYAEMLRRGEQGDPACRRVVDDAARALGMLVATVSNMTLTDTLVLAGEGIGAYRVGETAFVEGVRARRLAGEQGLDIRVLDPSFDEWARGGAVVALQHWLGLR